MFPSRATTMVPMWPDLVKAGGGQPQPVGLAGEHEQRPSPPSARAACIPAMSLAGMSPSVLSTACSMAGTTQPPARMLPWIA